MTVEPGRNNKQANPGPETTDRSGERQSIDLQNGKSLEKEFEKIRGLRDLREFLCGDSSQRSTGQGSKGTLKDRAAGARSKDAPFHLVHELIIGPQGNSIQKMRPNLTPRRNFGPHGRFQSLRTPSSTKRGRSCDYSASSANPFTSRSIARNLASSSASWSSLSAFDPSDSARAGSSCTSTNNPSIPLATAARESVSINCG